ncbi:hypothetical protein GE09DRAFT_1070132 [Coniochaeta sp. 2T2.1]|nr:hypothetical protein GE09DRAFT_1070132 [Coniochaeta sp. 2T2.1]
MPLQLAKGRSNRDPPPSLFLHPSPAASHVSLPALAGEVAASLPTNIAPSVSREQDHPSSRRNGAQTFRSPLAVPPQLGGTGGPLPRLESSRVTDRTDALWAEMQATLEEVELSASGGTRVFGPDHDRKLGELRAAQIALAQAWARSEADEAIETTGGMDMRSLRTVEDGGGKTTDAGAGASTAGTGSVRPGSSGGIGGGQTGGQERERLGQKLEEETEVDILLARKRREANDRYFQRVNQGVLDVVDKLEEVAVAMRAVEQESKDIWAGDESPGVPASSQT